MTDAVATAGIAVFLLAGVAALLVAAAIPIQLLRRRPTRPVLTLVGWFSGAALLGLAVGGATLALAFGGIIPEPGQQTAAVRPALKRSAHDLVLDAAAFPLPAYTMAEDRASGSGWHRLFKPPAAGDPQFGDVSITITPDASVDWVKRQSCSWNSKTPPSTSEQISAAVLGDASRGCRFRWTDGDRWYSLMATTGRVGITASVFVPVPAMLTRSTAVSKTPTFSPEESPFPDDRGAMTFLERLVERQFALFDRVEPPDLLNLTVPQDPLSARLTEKFRFNPPALLPAAILGEPYRFSFCRPERQTALEPCAAGTGLTVPAGGAPPYRFMYARSGGLPPFGLVLHPNGELEGMPDARRGPQPPARFRVCVADAKDDTVCRDVAIELRRAVP